MVLRPEVLPPLDSSDVRWRDVVTWTHDSARNNIGHAMSEERPLLSVIIPAYNEVDQIGATVASVVTYLEGLEDRLDWEVIVVDDGSTDQTLEAATRAAEDEPRVRVARHPANFNLGQALRYGFSLAKGDYLVTMDADLSYDCDHIGRLVEVLTTTTAKVVIASPYMAGGTVTGVPALRLVASRMANRLLARAAKGDLTTVTGMVRAYDAVFLRKLDLKAMDVEINAEIIYKAQLMRARIVEIPAHLVWTRDDGKHRPFRPGRSVMGFAFVSFLFRPYAFFLMPSALLAVLSTLLWISVLLTTDADRSLMAATVAATSTIASVILAGLGVLSAQAKRYFEELFHLGTATSSERRRVHDA
jgi:glycosyltransferase involved in cell wall biosynthesis